MKPKYNNHKTIIDGITFDSLKEADFYLHLLDKEVKFEMQVPFVLVDGYTNGVGQRIRPMKYVADFVYTDNDGIHIVDVKGMKTDVYKLKKKLFEQKYYPLVIEER